MKKSVLIIGVIVVVVLLGAVAFFVFGPRGMSEKDILSNPQYAIEFCQNSPAGKQTDCYFQLANVLAKDSPDVALQACLALVNQDDKQGCTEDLASKQEDKTKAVGMCNSAGEDNKFREHCYGAIMSDSGDLNDEAKLLMCDSKTGAEKDNCYRGLAERFLLSNISKNIEICNKISDKSTKDSCLNNILGNPEIVQANPSLAVGICGSLALKSNCYNYVAQTLSGVDPKQGALVCQKLSDEVQVSNCYRGVWFSFESIVSQNYDFTVDLCNALTVKKDDCLRNAIQVFLNADKTKAEALCKFMSSAIYSSCVEDVSNGLSPRQ